eukprot:CAMPEP_0196821062 /NCGR_PEP_ID=MMETSP1362-20130617/77635_1 /TAXON_ID=163516 /ORGANISM="Leptocylindrus danicus, Strain CCMP1856" /LENGTH=260 /DNA_ID=CAMNT_0042200125 /DNA_START=120 /DNA_END=899 /DNA_ORIENTATION=-
MKNHLLMATTAAAFSLTHGFAPSGALAPKRAKNSVGNAAKQANKLHNKLVILKSSLEEDPSDNAANVNASKNENSKLLDALKEKIKLPKSPEDGTVISGDVGAIFLYSYIDHFANNAYSKYLTLEHNMNAESYGAHAIWLDRTLNHGYLPPTLEPLVSGSTPCYSNMLHSPGICAVMMVSTWAVAGYFTGAFLFENTVMCDLRRAVVTTGKTWMVACALMLGIVVTGNAMCGCPLHQGQFTLTKTDADYIFDSMSVLVTW